jgi:hypothetical protein
MWEGFIRYDSSNIQYAKISVQYVIIEDFFCDGKEVGVYLPFST